MRISLIISTVGDEVYLERLFSSLLRQTYSNFEIIVVGPVEDTALRQYLQRWPDSRIRYAGGAKGHSKALNIGLADARGDLIAFPDDDSWYSETLLEHVVDVMARHPEWAGISGKSVAEDGTPSSGRWDTNAGPIHRDNVWVRGCTITLFVRREAIANVWFDEELGLGAGTPWGGGEDFDFVLQIVNRGNIISYEPSIQVGHPEWSKAPYPPAVCSKGRSYARGLGRVLRKHQYPVTSLVYHVVRPLGGSLLALLCMKKAKARYHWSVFLGRFAGCTSSYAIPAAQLPSNSDVHRSSQPRVSPGVDCAGSTTARNPDARSQQSCAD